MSEWGELRREAERLAAARASGEVERLADRLRTLEKLERGDEL